MASSLTASAAPTTTHGSPCGCGGHSPCGPGEVSGMERTRFFPGMLVTPDDLTQDQLYFRDKSRRHNRLLHGWGVVCGARVMAHATDACKVVVEPGYILGPYGDEILLEQNVEVDVCSEGVDGNAVSPCGGIDPWCSDVRASRPGGRPFYLAVKYAECESRPVRVHGPGCGCDSAGCEYSRLRDSFAIKLLPDLPHGYDTTAGKSDFRLAFTCGKRGEEATGRDCPSCPPEPWVVLATILFNDDGTIKQIDCFQHRRYVASFAEFFFTCDSRSLYQAGPLIIAERAVSAEPARMLIAVTSGAGNLAYLPARFAVNAGEPLSAFLAREGGQEFVDPETEKPFFLRDVLAIAGADPNLTVGSMADVAALVQGTRLRVTDLADVRTRLTGGILDASGAQRLEAAHAGAPASVVALPATAIDGVGATSALGQKLAGVTIGAIAEQEREGFVSTMLAGVAANRQAALRRQAEEEWEKASTASRLTASWRTQPHS